MCLFGILAACGNTGATSDAAPGEPTLMEAKAANDRAERDAVLATPIVAAAFEAFPEAELIGWTHNRSGT